MISDLSAEIIIIGKEILSGFRRDCNVESIARWLLKNGFGLDKVQIIGDIDKDIAEALKLTKARLIFVTGGIGTTRDDRTRFVIADAFKRKLRLSKESVVCLSEKLRKRNVFFTNRYRELCKFPESALRLDNPRGLAEAFILSVKSRAFIVLPGVPFEIESILALPSFNENIRHFFSTKKCEGHILGLVGLRESEIEDICLDIPEFQRGKVSLLPSPGLVYLILQNKKLLPLLKKRFGNYIFTYSGENLEQVVIELLKRQNKTCSVAESCTGGMLGEVLTSVSGASQVFNGGLIVYQNEIKIKELGVSSNTLKNFGAVSKITAKEMACCVRKKMKSDWGIAITGIAGPSGGSKEKPVGTVFIAVSGNKQNTVIKNIFSGDRNIVRISAVRFALNLLRRMILETVK